MLRQRTGKQMKGLTAIKIHVPNNLMVKFPRKVVDIVGCIQVWTRHARIQPNLAPNKA